MTHAFVGISPARDAGRRFDLIPPFDLVVLFLVERMLFDELPDTRLASLFALSEDASLSAKECRELARGIEGFLEGDTCDYLAWHIESDCEHAIPGYLVPKFVKEQLITLNRFLCHSGGLRVEARAEPRRHFGKRVER